MGGRSCFGKKRGLWVAVFGADGAGKSAVIRRLASDPSLPFCGMQQFHFRPMFQQRWKESAPVTRPHAKPPRGTMISILKLLYWLADCWFGYLTTVRPARANARLVIFDRYLHDILIDPLRYRIPKSSLRFARLIVRLAPSPDLYVLLDVPAEIVQQRKAEVSPAESQRQRLAYLDMFQSLPNAFVVSAAASVDEVAEEIKSVILESLTGKFLNRTEVSLLADF
jgi:thymidylate kinase